MITPRLDWSASAVFPEGFKLRPTIGGLRNVKLGGKIPSFSTLPGVTCIPNPECWEECYARGYIRPRPSVYKSYLKNTRLMIKYPAASFSYILQWLLNRSGSNPRLWRDHPVEYFRIDVAGDFPDQKSIDSWSEIARVCSSVYFLAFTKRYVERAGSFIGDFSRIPDNFSVLYSHWVGLDMPDSLPAGVAGVAWLYNPLDERQAGALPCPGTCANCKICWLLKDRSVRSVKFYLHGKGRARPAAFDH